MSFSINLEMPEIVRNYAMYLRNIKGLSKNTVDEYCMDLRSLFRFLLAADLHPNENPQEIKYEEIKVNQIGLDFIRKISSYDIFEFMNYATDNRNNISSTRQRKSSSIKSFFRYLAQHEKLLDVDPTENLISPKTKKSLPHFLTLEQSFDLLGAIEGTFQARDYCMIVMFLNCGLRLSELVNINLSDILRNNNTIRILGKGNRERIIYLNDLCLDAIENYLKVRPNEGVIDKNAMFLSRRKKRISPKTVQCTVKKYLDKIGLSGPGYSVHKLRHTAATLMYQYGNVDIRVLQDILGHQNLGTTEIYTHTSSKQMEDAVNKNPLRKRR